jgi:hypothetical protein
MKGLRVVFLLVLCGVTIWNIITACSPGQPTRNVIAVVTGPSSVRVGETAQLSITLTFPDGRNNPVPPSQTTSIEVRSSDTRILTVTPSAEVQGISPGSAVVTVTPSMAIAENYNRVPGTIAIRVVP